MNAQAFDAAFAQLNDAQREAVETIDGPVLVVAGPGTGKTQLLSMRVANILRRSDASAHNILCMTFTEDAAHNMRERLAGIIGPAAYDVEIQTFHSFGASVIARYGEYFYQGIGSQPIDELAGHEIFEKIFQKLPQDNPLSAQFENDFLYLKGAQSAVDNFKTAGLAPTEVRAIAKSNLDFAGHANRAVAEAMQGFTRIDKSSPERFKKLLSLLQALTSPDASTPLFVKPLATIVVDALHAALELVEAHGKTTPLTEFKNAFLVRSAAGEWQLKDSEASKKLLALADIYEQYLLQLRESNLIDFNDMITRVVHALETFDELRLNLQEQYQYILVDEFQDTSLAQLRLVTALTDNPVFEGRPNILAVGDDDQAIYSFQGAELSNILSFHAQYQDVKVITLTENYRSRQAVLQAAKFVIEQSSERLVAQLQGVTKDIVARNETLPEPTIAHHRFASAEQQRQWVADQIAKLIADGTSPSDIAVITAKHNGLRMVVPFLAAAGIPVRYDKRENILEVPAIVELLTMARLTVALADNTQMIANALFPQVLSYACWGLSTKQIWQLYLHNYRKRSPWLETALQSGDSEIARIAEFFIALGTRAKTSSLETMIDYLVGNEAVGMQAGDGEQLSLEPSTFISPFKAFYFSDENRRFQPNDYLELLSHLRFLRERLREFRATEQLTLQDIVKYVALVEGAGIQLVDTTPHREKTDAVSLYTAHSSKGLEFGSVFIVDANHDIWNSSGSPLGKISMPTNLPIERSAGSEEERRRLLYVAMTRAKHRLVITGFQANKRGNAPLKYLTGSEEELPAGLFPTEHDASEQSPQEVTAALTTSWHDRHLTARLQPSMKELLLPTLENYRLSVTHLQRFLNVADGGPAQWFLQCLLHFPQASTPNMAFGNAVHATLEAAQKSFKKTGERRSIDDLLTDFAVSLHQCRLDQEAEARLLSFGNKILRHYFAARYADFRQEEFFEFDVSSRQVIISGARLTGKIDRITPLGDNDVRVTDFKTGKPMHSWDTPDPHRQIRLHHYKQQLTFYRLLLEESNAFGPHTKVIDTAIEFVQPDASGELVPPLTFMPTDDDVARLRGIIAGAWRAITTLEFPDTTQYESTLQGITQFETDLAES
ncbi:MAG TPA: ATP-dependent DNA helicase [Candidatus Saccharimonadales bacterium]|nr:ATP-dependent DNA helicase [Candidatus Saccharimonadales bacterium]